MGHRSQVYGPWLGLRKRAGGSQIALSAVISRAFARTPHTLYVRATVDVTRNNSRPCWTDV